MEADIRIAPLYVQIYLSNSKMRPLFLSSAVDVPFVSERIVWLPFAGPSVRQHSCASETSKATLPSGPGRSFQVLESQPWKK